MIPQRRRSATPFTVCLLLICLTSSPASSEEGTRFELTVEAPTPNSIFSGLRDLAFVSGVARSRASASALFDVIVVIDTSYSTSAPAGSDVDGDGRTGRRWGSPFLPIIPRLLHFPNTDSGDSVLAAEIQAARTLVNQLDPETTRVGVVSFSGHPASRRPDARTEVTLTSSYEKVHAGLTRLLNRGPQGQTNVYEAVRVLTSELTGSIDALSEARGEARKIALFMTDGHPTLPVRHWAAENERLAITAARTAGRSEVRIDAFAIGPEATDHPFVMEEMARVTGGVFTPVRDPRELVAVFRDLEFADLEAIEIRNATTGKAAAYVMADPEGSFSGLVALQDGRNELEIRARTRDGRTQRVMVPVNRVRGELTAPLTPRLRSRRTRLLKNLLIDLQGDRLTLEQRHAEQIRRDLRVEIEHAKDAARRRQRSLQVAPDG